MSPDHSSLFAKMQDALAKIETIQFSSELFRPGEDQPWKTSETHIEEPNRFRDNTTASEIGNIVHIADLATGRYTAISPVGKRAMVGNILNVERVQELFDSFVTVLRNANADETELVDRYERDGIWFAEYEYVTGLGDTAAMLVKVSVDETTALPVEIRFVDLDGFHFRTINNIEFDMPFDPSLFSTIPPDDYEVTEQDIN